MEEFRIYSPEDIIQSNLRETGTRYGWICEQERAHLRELAREITEGGEPFSEVTASLPDYKLPPDTVFSGARENRETIERFATGHETFRDVLFCRELCRLWEEKEPIVPDLFFPETEPLREDAAGRIAYQKNAYADSAYLRFAPLSDAARAVSVHGFNEVCEALYNGVCQYGILPVENSSEGPLTAFLRLISRYDLKIAAVCDIFSADRERFTRFALLRKNMTPILRFSDFEERFFEFSLPSDPGSASKILRAAEFSGLRIFRAALGCDAGEPPSPSHFLFRTDGGDLPTFLTYLAMAFPHYTPIGLYSNLPV